MFNRIVHSMEPITLVGGGDATPSDLIKALTLGPICVAADGGAVLSFRAGVKPEAVIGDFDSIPPDILEQIPVDRQHFVEEQQSTDFEKALVRVDAPVILGVGFTGGRVDHHLAAYHVLSAFPHQSCVLLAADEIILLAPPRLALPTHEGDVVSMFPLLPVTGRSQGLEWPIEGMHFELGKKIGTSNRATGPSTIEMDSPGMLLILPIGLLGPVVSELLQPKAARWPAPAR